MNSGSLSSGGDAGVILRPARPEDHAHVVALLEAAALPVAGVDDWFSRFIIAECADRIVGVAGLEVYSSDGLLRSVAVADDWRGRGLGGALTAEVLRAAARDSIARVYLLTMTAAEFFPRLGFQRIERAEASDAVKASLEFSELCPATSVVMVRSIDDADSLP